jgi:hypothetical protein
MRAKIVFHDGSWIAGRRVSNWEIFKSHMPETQGTHHWWVEDMSGEFVGVTREYISERVAVPINSMKCCVFLR